MGATHVIAVDPNPYRRNQAEKLGATVLDPTTASSTLPRPTRQPRRLRRRLRRLRRPRHPAHPLRVRPPRSHRHHRRAPERTRRAIDIAAYINKKRITLRGIFGRRLWDTWEQLLLLVESGKLDLDWLITHRLNLAESDEAIELLTGEANKVLLVPDLT